MKILNKILPFLLAGVLLTGCSDFFGSKGDSITDEIFEEGRQDPNLIVDEVGYAALVPFWDGFDSPTDVYVGFDELVYVTDAEGVHVLDRAGRKYDTFALRGAVSVTQDRLLNLYVAARYDTVITAVDPDIEWDLPAVYKIHGLNQGNPEVIDVLLDNGADGTLESDIGKTAFDYAEENSFIKDTDAYWRLNDAQYE